METSIQTRPKTAFRPARSQSYETTYQREFSAIKRGSTINEGVPSGQRFLIGSPYQITDPVGVTSYTVDYTEQKNVQREPVIRLNTPRANRPHPHPQFTHWPRRPVTASPVMSEEMKQALRNQLTSTYQMDYIGKRRVGLSPCYSEYFILQELLKDFLFHWHTIDHALFGVIELIIRWIVNIDDPMNMLYGQQLLLLDVLHTLLEFQLKQSFH